MYFTIGLAVTAFMLGRGEDWLSAFFMGLVWPLVLVSMIMASYSR